MHILFALLWAGFSIISSHTHIKTLCDNNTHLDTPSLYFQFDLWNLQEWSETLHATCQQTGITESSEPTSGHSLIVCCLALENRKENSYFLLPPSFTKWWKWFVSLTNFFCTCASGPVKEGVPVLKLLVAWMTNHKSSPTQTKSFKSRQQNCF